MPDVALRAPTRTRTKPGLNWLPHGVFRSNPAPPPNGAFEPRVAQGLSASGPSAWLHRWAGGEGCISGPALCRSLREPNNEKAKPASGFALLPQMSLDCHLVEDVKHGMILGYGVKDSRRPVISLSTGIAF